MGVVADEEEQIELVNSKLSGMRLHFADLISLQHLTRKFPEHVANEDPSPEIVAERFKTLVIALREAAMAALGFAVAALDAYFDTLPDGVVRVEPLPNRSRGARSFTRTLRRVQRLLHQRH